MEKTVKGFSYILKSLDRTVRRVMDGMDRRRAIVELARMQDWRLTDLGIEHGRIPEIVEGLIAQREATRQRPQQAALPPATSAGGLSGGQMPGIPA